jgi:hypothetical protein
MIPSSPRVYRRRSARVKRKSSSGKLAQRMMIGVTEIRVAAWPSVKFRTDTAEIQVLCMHIDGVIFHDLSIFN